MDNNIIGVILVAVAFALAARASGTEAMDRVLAALDTGFDLILIVLHWIIAAVPLAVFGKVARVVGTQGFQPFLALGWFIVAVVIALSLQAIYYLAGVHLSSRVSPLRLLAGTRDALAMAFSTATSTVTMPVTYASLREKIGLREEAASLGALVGSNFNNDGTALYEAMAALFIAQMMGTDLSLGQQVMVVLTSVVASGRCGGHPGGGPRDDDPGLLGRAPADELHRSAAAGGLVPGSLPHDAQRDGRHQRELHPGREALGSDPAGTRRGRRRSADLDPRIYER